MRDRGSHNRFPVLAAVQPTLRLSNTGTDLVSALPGVAFRRVIPLIAEMGVIVMI